MGRRSQNALSVRRMPVAPIWNPEGGLLTKTRLWSIWCSLRGHKYLLLATEEGSEHRELLHTVVLKACLRCGFTDEECVDCDWEAWEEWL